MQSVTPEGQQSQGHVTTDDQSASSSWCRAPSGAYDQILASATTVTVLWLWGVLSDDRTDSISSQGDGQLCMLTIFTLLRV
jgi:hypothetical protein